MEIRFTESAKEAIKYAKGTAKSSGSRYTGTQHLLIGLYLADGVSGTVLAHNGVQLDSLENIAGLLGGASMDGIPMDVPDDGELPEESNNLLKIYNDAERISKKLGLSRVGTDHLLIALLQDPGCIAFKALLGLRIDRKELYSDMMDAYGMRGASAGRTPDEIRKSGPVRKQPQKETGKSESAISRFTKDIIEQARLGELDPVIGREQEIERVLQIICRRLKNNACLVGEPGVGKTAIVEGIAARIAEGAVPDILKSKKLLRLDLTGMVAGTKYRGEFEERIKKLVDEVKEDGNVILFIDELHTIIGAGGSEGGMDASNILKPAMSRGDFQIIGATTIDEYRKRIEKDAALERRFQPVMVDEPTREETLLILKGLAPRYEEYHGIEITDEALTAAVDYSIRYINDRFLPDKAIDVIDETASRKKLNMARIRIGRISLESEEEGENVFRIPAMIRDLESELSDLITAGDIDEASVINSRIEQLRQRSSRLGQAETEQASAGPEEVADITFTGGIMPGRVTEPDVAETIAIWSKIPVAKISSDDMTKLSDLEDILKERVIGQDDAVSALAKAIKRNRVGLGEPDRPIGTFLFLGPTGVGKTELSKALAEALFDDEKKMIRVDMSEYMEPHSVSKFIGSPPGYVGFDEGGQLTEQIRRNPYSVVLFDEIEKAHPDVFNSLLQILDDGILTDSKGRTVSFRNAIIIMTSNAGAQSIIDPKSLGFMTEEDSEERDYMRMKEGVMDEINHIFKPEFINRLDEIMVFRSLTKEDVRKISEIMLGRFIRRAEGSLDISIGFDESVTEHIFNKGYDKKFGARPLRRMLQSEVEDPLASKVISGEIKSGDSVRIISDGENIVFKKVRKRKTKSSI